MSYYWSGPGVDTDQPDTTTNQPGIFTFVVIGTNGCISATNVTVIEDFELPDIFAEVVGVLDCNTSSVTLSGGSATQDVIYFCKEPLH